MRVKCAFLVAALAAFSAVHANDLRTGVGGAIGGAGGAAIGNHVGGSTGAIVGGAVGGAAGGAVGATGKARTGAAIGGAVGGGAGAAIGNEVGGPTGAIVGAGVGGAAGAVIGGKMTADSKPATQATVHRRCFTPPALPRTTTTQAATGTIPARAGRSATASTSTSTNTRTDLRPARTRRLARRAGRLVFLRRRSGTDRAVEGTSPPSRPGAAPGPSAS